MRSLLPKSLNGLLLLGLGILAAPLLLSIFNATVEMQRLATQSQRLVTQSVQATRLARDMYLQISLLARSAKLYQVLGDTSVLSAFNERDQDLDSTVNKLRDTLGGPQTSGLLDKIKAQQSLIRDEVSKGPGQPASAGNLEELFAGLTAFADKVTDQKNGQIDAEVDALTAKANRERRELFIESTLLLPLVGIVVLVFTLRLSRPLRQIDRAIDALGRGNYNEAISVQGPVDLERLGHELEWLRNRLFEVAEDRNRFLRHMSHELKTPLANIREGTELLMDGAVGPMHPGQREVVAILRDNGLKLQRMIENLLSFSAWQSNASGLDIAEFRLRPLVKQVLENQQLTLVSQRVRLEVQIEDLLLEADRGKVRLILENLLSNAIKYSPRGGNVWVQAHHEDSMLVLQVADSGPGIPLAERPRIFEAFYTGRAPSGHVPGTGIGLSVVNEFVHMQNGSIEIVDGIRPGAHFRIRMPMRIEKENPLGRQASAA